MYKNLEKFVEWLKKVAKSEVTDTYIKYALEELETQYGNSGMQEYELGPFETKSGNPETYSYNTEEEEDHGIITITYIF